MMNILYLFSNLMWFGVMTLFMISCGDLNQEKLTKLSESPEAPIPQYITIKINNYQPQAGNSYQNLFVSNFTVRPSNGRLKVSSSRDGLSDDLKNSTFKDYGFTVGIPESVSGFSDLVLYNMGIKRDQQSLLYCADSQRKNSSNDALIYNDSRREGSPQTFMGLRDCQKMYLGLNHYKFDNNGNGIPDYLEIRCGMNPLDKNQAFLSTAGDGVANIDKCKSNIPIDENFYTQPNQLFAYKYETKINEDDSKTFTVSNIPIVDKDQENFLAIYLVESDLSSKTTSLYSAYMIVKQGYGGKTIEFDYWATDSTKFFNQEIVLP